MSMMYRIFYGILGTGARSPESLLGQIDRLPRTGRRQAVIAAMQALLAERGRALQDALRSKRKREKVVQSYVDVWNQHQASLSNRGLSDPFEGLFREMASRATLS